MSAIKDYLQANPTVWQANPDNTEFVNNNAEQATFFVISTDGEDFLTTVSRETGEPALGTVKTQITQLTDIPFYVEGTSITEEELSESPLSQVSNSINELTSDEDVSDRKTAN